MFWSELHDKICYTIKNEIPAVQTCENYPVVRKEILAPAIFVELTSLEPGKDPGTEELALRARFEARVIIDSSIDNAYVVVRSLVARVAKVINRNSWGISNVSPAEFLSAEGDGFKPELDSYLVWSVEWVHEIHTGYSIWVEGEIKPHFINIGDKSARA